MGDRKELLRRARETAPTVLPRAISQAVILALGDAFYDQRAYQDQLVGEVLALADPGGIEPGSAELTPEQVEELKARFEAVKHGPPTLLPGLGVTQEQVDRVASLIDKGVGPAKAFRVAGIPVQEGQPE